MVLAQCSERSLHRNYSLQDRHLYLAVYQDFCALNLFPIMRDFKFSKYVDGKSRNLKESNKNAVVMLLLNGREQ